MWSKLCSRCHGAFSDPDIAVMENEVDHASKAILAHVACFFGKGHKGGYFCGVATLDSARSKELDEQAKAFAEALEANMRAEEWTYEFDLSKWPRVMQIVLQQQHRRSASAS